MAKSRAAGFLDYEDSAGSFRDLFATLRVRKVIPTSDAGVHRHALA
jgi:hypothetical protein